MSLFAMTRVGRVALDAANRILSPPPNASSQEVRKNGLFCLAIGIACFALGALGMTLNRDWIALAAIPAIAGYAFLIVGGYRAVFGRSPRASSPGELSLHRAIFAVVFIVLTVGAFVILMLTFDGAFLTPWGRVLGAALARR